MSTITILSKILLVFSFLTLFASCKNEKKIHKFPLVNSLTAVKPIENIELNRFDTQLFELVSKGSPAAVVDSLNAKYPDFFPFYTGEMLGLSSPFYSDAMNQASRLQFFTDPGVRILLDTVVKSHSSLDISDLKKHLAYYKKLLPAPDTFKIWTINSIFNYQCATYGDTILIGLDLFMGEKFQYPENIPHFIRHTYSKEYLAPKVLRTLLEKDVEQPKSYKMLDQMIRNGKIMYAMQMMLPEFPEYMVTNYTKEQYIWVRKHEGQIWETFLSDDLLFSNDYDKYRKHVEPSPNAPNMPAEAPGETGNYIGWLIVQKFMEKYPQTTLKQLFDNQDAQKILTASRYKP